MCTVTIQLTWIDWEERLARIAFVRTELSSWALERKIVALPKRILVLSKALVLTDALARAVTLGITIRVKLVRACPETGVEGRTVMTTGTRASMGKEIIGRKKAHCKRG